MVAMSIASAASGTDAVSRPRSGRGANSDDDRGGFLDALSNSGGGQNQPVANDDDASAKQAAQSSAEDQAAQDDSQPASGKATAATVADAMATLGVSAGKITAAVTLPGGTATAATDSKGSAKAPAQPDVQPTVLADDSAAASVVQDATADDAAAQPPVENVLSRLAAIADAATAIDNKAAAAEGTDKTQTKPSKTDSSDSSVADATGSPAAGSSAAVVDALSLLTAAAQAQAATIAVATAGQLAQSAGKPPLPSVATAAMTASDSDAASADGLSMPASAKADIADLMSSSAGGKTDTTDADDSSKGTFRVTSATGRSQAIDLSISKAADDASQVDVKAANGSGTGAETVTVLDSRRYLGLANGSNSASVANALVSDKSLAAAMKADSIANATSSTSRVVNTLKIEMTPEKLGSVTATMRLSGEQLSVDLRVQSAEAYRQLTNDQSAMADSLRAQGYKVDQITVSYAPQTSADSGSQQNNGQSGFQGQQQSGTSQGQGSEAQSRRQNSGQQTNEQDNLRRAQTGDDGLGSSAQRISSAGVYI